MTVLLPSDAVEVWDVAPTPDEHGWMQETVPVQVWSGWGSVQEATPDQDPQAVDRGGEGPYEPFTARGAVAYLPTDSGAVAGRVALARGIWWFIETVHEVPDPTGGPLGVLVCGFKERVMEPAP